MRGPRSSNRRSARRAVTMPLTGSACSTRPLRDRRAQADASASIVVPVHLIQHLINLLAFSQTTEAAAQPTPKSFRPSSENRRNEAAHSTIVSGGTSGREVGFEGDVPRRHRQPGAHTLEGAPPAIVPAAAVDARPPEVSVRLLSDAAGRQAAITRCIHACTGQRRPVQYMNG